MSESSSYSNPLGALPKEAKAPEGRAATAAPSQRRYGRLAWRITVRYLILGLVWKAVTDWMLWRLAPGRVLLTELVACKGTIFIACSAIMLYLILRREMTHGAKATDARSDAERAILEHKAAYFSLVEQMPCGVLQRDHEGRLVFVNAWLRELLGAAEPAELSAAPSCELIADAVLDRGAQFLREVQSHQGDDGEHRPLPKRGEVSRVVAPFTSNDGSTRWLEITTGPRYDGNGEVAGSQGIVLDITARLDAEAKHRASEEVLTLASEVGRVGTFVLDESTGVLQASKVLKELDQLGDPLDRNAAMIEATVPEDRPLLLAAKHKGTNPTGDGRQDVEFRMRTPSGTIQWVRLQAQTWFQGKGSARRPIQTIGVVLDITNRKNVEAALRANQERYVSLFENMMNGIALCEMIFEEGKAVDFKYLAVNKAFGQLTGLRDVVGKRVSEVIPGFAKSDPDLLNRFGEVARSGIGQRFECQIKSLNDWYSMAVYQPAPGQFVTVFDVVTEAKKSEDGLRTLSRAIEQSPTSIVITDRNGFIQFVNPRFTEVSGYTWDEVHGQNLRLVKSGGARPGVNEDVWGTLLKGTEWRGEISNSNKAGKLLYEYASISPVQDETGAITHYVAVMEDVTERRQLQAQTQRTQRLESVGLLASGIAHDLNNILAPILIATDLIRQTDAPAAVEELVVMVEASAQRAANIVQQLLAFGRGASGTRSPLEVGRILKEMGTIMKETFPRELELSSEISADLNQIMADPTQLHQVVLNLCVNARDAMPNGGKLQLSARNTQIDSIQADRNPPAKPGPYIVIGVSDTGTGMSSELQERIFDPFFTTKEEGKGTGLGLSTVMGIVRSYGGFITLESTPGQGSCFEIYLPAMTSVPETQPSVFRTELSPGRGQLILLVDDELNLGNALSLIFEVQGYRTLQAPNGIEAMKLFREHGPEISLVFTDIMMPGMNGITLVRELRKLRPDIRFVVSTGLEPSSKLRELAELGIPGALPKPCSAYDAIMAVQKVLAA